MTDLEQKEKRALKRHKKNREAIVKRYPINEQEGILDNWKFDEELHMETQRFLKELKQIRNIEDC